MPDDDVEVFGRNGPDWNLTPKAFGDFVIPSDAGRIGSAFVDYYLF